MLYIGLINPHESLFTYPPGMSADDFSMPNHIPAFVDEVVAGASMEVIDSCGGNERCIFDASQTGNLDIGLKTMKIDAINKENEILSGKRIKTKIQNSTLPFFHWGFF